jgi:hypothetical protein
MNKTEWKKVSKISVDEIRQKRIWKVLEGKGCPLYEWRVVAVARVSHADTILHPAVLVESGKRVYPALVSKYYEDGGEVGEYLFHDGSRWMLFDNRAEPIKEVEGIFLGYISELDHHEYQKGSLDNRKFNYDRFDFYSRQIGSDRIEKFIEKKIGLPKKVLSLSVSEQKELLRSWLLEADQLHRSFKVSQGNKKVTQASELEELLMMTDDGKEALRELLHDKEESVWMSMIYALLPIYRDECLQLITRVSKRDTLEGLAARMNLKTIKEKGSLA